MPTSAPNVPSERDFKGYKGTVSKTRSALGRERQSGSCTGIRLTNIHANLHLEDFHNTSPNEQEAYLRNFDLGEEAKWAKSFKDGFSAAPIAKEFLCMIEPWEDITKKSIKEMKSREMEFKLKDKYVDMKLFDEGKDDDGLEYRESRVIVSVDWVNRKGYEVVTNLIGHETDSDMNEGYLINESLPPLIKAGKNPGVRLLFSVPVAMAATTTVATASSGRRSLSVSASAAAAADDDDDDEDELLAARVATADRLHISAGEWQGGGEM